MLSEVHENTKLAQYDKVPRKEETRKRAIAKALHLEGHSDFAPDVLGFSGLFGLKILFSDVLRSAPGNRHVEPIRPAHYAQCACAL